VALDQPRYLDRRAGRNYTSNPALAMRGEPEAVSEDVQQQISAAARLRFEEERQDELFRRDARSRTAKVRDLQNEVRRLGVDGARELRAIDAQLEQLGRKVSRRRATA
jgi:hypothetical protein